MAQGFSSTNRSYSQTIVLPGTPTITPNFVGQEYIDSITGAIYKAMGTNGSYNWAFIGRGNTSSFNKNTINGLVGWYDANDTATLTIGAGNSVTAWSDKSIALRHLTLTPATKPVWTSNVQNGLPGIYFDGSSYIYATGLSNQTSTTPSIYAVFKPTAWGTGDYQSVCICANATPGALVSFLKNTGNTNNFVFSYNAYDVTSSGVVSGNTHVIGYRVNGTNSKIDINGTSSNLNVGTTGIISTNMYIGCNVAGNQRCTMYFCELLLFNGLLVDSDHAQVMAYLNNKYGVY